MLTEPLPNTLDVRKAAARGVSVSGTLKPLDLQRFRALLAGDEGDIQARLAFSRDEEGRYLAAVTVDADVEVVCQRCLEPMQQSVHTENALAIVWTDEQAAHLPRHLEPLILAEEAGNLWQLVEDELILGLPSFSYHENKACNEFLAELTADEPGPATPERAATEKRSNPFDVLEQLKSGDKD